MRSWVYGAGFGTLTGIRGSSAICAFAMRRQQQRQLSSLLEFGGKIA
jgi:hypothetical protein